MPADVNEMTASTVPLLPPRLFPLPREATALAVFHLKNDQINDELGQLCCDIFNHVVEDGKTYPMVRPLLCHGCVDRPSWMNTDLGEVACSVRRRKRLTLWTRLGSITSVCDLLALHIRFCSCLLLIPADHHSRL